MTSKRGNMPWISIIFLRELRASVYSVSKALSFCHSCNRPGIRAGAANLPTPAIFADMAAASGRSGLPVRSLAIDGSAFCILAQELL